MWPKRPAINNGLLQPADVQAARIVYRSTLAIQTSSNSSFCDCYCSEWDTDGHCDFSGIFKEKLKEGGIEGLDEMIDKVILEEIDHSFAYDRILKSSYSHSQSKIN